MSVDTSQIAKLDVEPGELPATMAAWVIRAEREGEPTEAFQLEEMEVPEPAAFEVIVRVMAAGVNFNNVWAALGKPISVFRHRQEDHHIGGSDASGHRVEGRRGRHALEARRRGRRALQPGLLRGSGGARAGPAGGPEPADLGLRDHVGLVRAVLQGPGPAAAAQAGGTGLGGGGLLRAHVLHRLPHAGRPGAPAGGPPRPDLGRRRRPRRVRHPALQALRRGLGRRRLEPPRRASWSSSSAPSTTSTATSSRA